MDCVSHITSSAELIGLFESLKFKFDMSVDDATSCERWINNDATRKISEVEQNLIMATHTSCEMRISCVANSQFTCGQNPTIVTYE